MNRRKEQTRTQRIRTSQTPFRFWWLGCFALAGRAALAGDDLPAPVGGKSITIAAPFLKRVDAFDRKVVFFTKDVDLPCLKVPKRGEHIDPPRISIRPNESASGSVVMSKDGVLLFCTSERIVRLEKDNRLGDEVVKDVVALPDLTLAGNARHVPGLHFMELLAASATKDVIYVGFSDVPRDAPPAQPISPDNCRYFLGKLELAVKRLTLVPTRHVIGTAIDPDRDLFYQPRGKSILRMRFDGSVDTQWNVASWPALCWLAPGRNSLLFYWRANRSGYFSLLDFTTGSETLLPIKGRAPVFAADDLLYYINDEDRENGVFDTSLLRFEIGQKEPVCLFKVSCKRVRFPDTSPGVAPKLSADRSWLAWPLPVERPETGTILLNLRNNEYRVLDGCWYGIPHHF